jgi:hypothetical protein
MACTESSFNTKILNLNEIIFPENTTNKKVRIENKIYEGIKSFFGSFLPKINIPSKLATVQKETPAALSGKWSLLQVGPQINTKTP